jgi:glycosyltransferase involved in cell wall biosynthesis
MQPLVSVILPVYNGEKYLAAALDSVFEQDYAPVEVIVVDDGSTDGTAQIAQARPEVRYSYQANQGCGGARNSGLAAASGDFIAFLDADDVWLPGKLRAQVDYLLAHPEVGFVLTRMESFLEPGATWPDGINQAYYAQRPVAYLPSALLCRRRVFEQVGSFDASYRTGEDSDWFFRARDAGVALAVLPEVLIRRRIHPGSVTRETRSVTTHLLKAVRASVDRKRGRTA